MSRPLPIDWDNGVSRLRFGCDSDPVCPVVALLTAVYAFFRVLAASGGLYGEGADTNIQVPVLVVLIMNEGALEATWVSGP